MQFRLQSNMKKVVNNMNEKTQKREIAFPIAAVFSLLNVLIGLINIFFTYTRMGGMPMPEILRISVLSILSLISSILEFP